MRLLTGRAGSGKTARVLREFRDAAAGARAEAVRLLVPTATLSEHLRNELVRDGMVLRSSQVTTLADFLKAIAPEFTMVREEHFQLMVDKAVRETHRTEFAKVRDLAGFPHRLATTIKELDTAGCTRAQMGTLPRDLAPFRDAIDAVWANVERQMRDRSVVTRGEALRRTAAKLAGVENVPQLPSRIWIDGFAQFSGPEIDLLSALGERTNLTVTLAEEGVPESLRAELLKRGFVEEKLSGARAPAVELIRPETAEREVDEICRRILAAVAAGKLFREIGVILRQRGHYEQLLRAAFQRFGIPAHFYFREPLTANPAGRLLSGVMDQLLQGWEHEATLSLLRIAPVLASSPDLDDFEIRVREALPGNGLEGLMKFAGDGRTLKRLLKNFRSLNSWTSAVDTPANWAARIASLPSYFRLGHLADGVSPQEAEHFRSLATGYRAFLKAMETAAEWWIDGTRKIKLTEFWDIAKAVVRLTNLDVPGRSRNTVHVVSAQEARQWDLSTVFVCGMVEKQFPCPNGQDPFFSDHALQSLNRFGVRLRTSRDKDEEERGLFDAVRARASESLVLSYPYLDSRGQRTLKSLFVRDDAESAVTESVRPALPEPVAPYSQPSRLQSSDLLESAFEQLSPLSVTALEKLMQCPFQFFTDRLLRTREMPLRPEDRLSSLLQGSIAHEFLAAWYVNRPDLEPLFNEVFDRACLKENVQPGFRTERLRRELLIAMHRFANDRSYPRAAESLIEQEFNYQVDPHLSIRGRLDRIDFFDNDQAVVVDYKFSTKAMNKKRVDDETKLQGPLYALALRKQFHEEPAAMVYIGLKDEKFAPAGWGEIAGVKGLDPMPPDWIESTVSRVSKKVAEFRTGAIEPRPANLSSCRYCTVRDACRFEQGAELETAIPAGD